MLRAMLPKSFFQTEALELSKGLLGCVLVHETDQGIAAGIIVETEAYGEGDEASHCYRGMTPRTQVMYGEGGHAYVYFTYGMHYCFNVVAGPEGKGQAVLIRALEPLEGITLMRQRRAKEALKDLCNGPAKLVQAMGITKADYGKPLFTGSLYIQPRKGTDKILIENGPRIGIKKAIDKPWRFWVRGSSYVSK